MAPVTCLETASLANSQREVRMKEDALDANHPQACDPSRSTRSTASSGKSGFLDSDTEGSAAYASRLTLFEQQQHELQQRWHPHLAEGQVTQSLASTCVGIASDSIQSNLTLVDRLKLVEQQLAAIPSPATIFAQIELVEQRILHKLRGMFEGMNKHMARLEEDVAMQQRRSEQLDRANSSELTSLRKFMGDASDVSLKLEDAASTLQKLSSLTSLLVSWSLENRPTAKKALEDDMRHALSENFSVDAASDKPSKDVSSISGNGLESVSLIEPSFETMTSKNVDVAPSEEAQTPILGHRTSLQDILRSVITTVDRALTQSGGGRTLKMNSNAPLKRSESVGNFGSGVELIRDHLPDNGTGSASTVEVISMSGSGKLTPAMPPSFVAPPPKSIVCHPANCSSLGPAMQVAGNRVPSRRPSMGSLPLSTVERQLSRPTFLGQTVLTQQSLSARAPSTPPGVLAESFHAATPDLTRTLPPKATDIDRRR